MDKINKKIVLAILLALVSGGCSLIEKPITNWFGTTTEPVERPYALEAKTIMVDDVNIAYMEAGSGSPVILVHGGVIPMNMAQSLLISPALPVSHFILHTGAVSTADTWNPNIESLAENFHVLAPDLPGFGGSDKPDIKYQLEDFAYYLVAFMRTKGIEKAALVGHGLGGQVAILCALEHPEKVDRLVLVDSFGAPAHFTPLDLSYPSALNLPMAGRLQKEKAAGINMAMPMARRALGGGLLLHKAAETSLSKKADKGEPKKQRTLLISDEENSRKFIQHVTDYKLDYVTTEEAKKEIRALHYAVMQTRRKDLAGRLPEIEVPVLVLSGFYDPVVTRDQARFMEQAMPRAQLMIYEKSAHYPMIEESERFNQDVSFFLSASNLAAK